MQSFTTQAALDSAIDGESIGDGIDEEALSAAAEEMGVDAAEAEVTDVSAPSRGFEVEEPDVLEALSNEQAAAALETIRALKLSKVGATGQWQQPRSLDAGPCCVRVTGTS